MNYREILLKCKGENVIINNNEERLVVDVEEDFLVLQGGNPQMKITEFLPFSSVLKLIRTDYATGSTQLALEVQYSGGDFYRNARH